MMLGNIQIQRWQHEVCNKRNLVMFKYEKFKYEKWRYYLVKENDNDWVDKVFKPTMNSGSWQ